MLRVCSGNRPAGRVPLRWASTGHQEQRRAAGGLFPQAADQMLPRQVPVAGRSRIQTVLGERTGHQLAYCTFFEQQWQRA